MRTNDAPGERGDLADSGAGGPDAPQRRPGGAGDLRQRLAALRAGHPSSPEYGGRGGEAADGAGGNDRAGEIGGAREEDAGDIDRAREDAGAAEGDPDGLPGPEGARSRGRSGGRGHASPGSAELGQPGLLRGSEPYRPWFSSGESLEPWFTGDPGDPPG